MARNDVYTAMEPVIPRRRSRGTFTKSSRALRANAREPTTAMPTPNRTNDVRKESAAASRMSRLMTENRALDRIIAARPAARPPGIARGGMAVSSLSWAHKDLNLGPTDYESVALTS